MSAINKVCVKRHIFTRVGSVEEVPLPRNRNYTHIVITSSATFTSCVLLTHDNRIVYRFIGVHPRNELVINFGNRYLNMDVMMKLDINSSIGSHVEVLFMVENSNYDAEIFKYCINNGVDIDVPMAKIVLTEDTMISIPPLGNLSCMVIACNEKFTKLCGDVCHTALETNIMLIDVSEYDLEKDMLIRTDIADGTEYYVYLLGSNDMKAAL